MANYLVELYVTAVPADAVRSGVDRAALRFERVAEAITGPRQEEGENT